jgi:hypothetical protein
MFQKKVQEAFLEDNTDYDVAVIYSRIYGDPGDMNARDMQMKLGGPFSRTNESMAKDGVGKKIEPGITKRTYRLSKLKG